ncbi:MAG: ribosomal subunit interface protein [Legionellales bacterium]|nr:ribosomal subunit interface protein [Legionellales bacterium]|tara:strand:+ start:12928 stop:13221 length:294 start_codon:yes stop_codon:yes gene_type:complete
MQINLTGHHVEVTPPLREYAVKKFERIVRHLDKIISINVVFEKQKVNQVAKATISAPGAQFYADEHSEDMYAAIDGLVDKLDKQVKQHKERQSSHKG